MPQRLGARTPRPAPYTKGSSLTMGPFLTLPEPARTSPQQPPCCMAFRRPRRLRIATPAEKFARCSSVRRRSRRKIHCLDDANPTPASARPQCVPPGTRPFTKHRQAAGSPPPSQCINASAMTVTYAASSTLANAPTATQERQRVAGTIPDVVDATTATRTKARAPACQALRPSADTSSTLRSP